MNLDNADKLGDASTPIDQYRTLSSTAMNILLIGARASGKTTIGCLLAAQMARQFMDLDDLVLATFARQTIQQVWATHGEQAWRAAETAALSTCLEHDRLVVALGGGTPMIPQARRLLEAEKAKGSVFIVYLSCEPAQLVDRLRNSPGDRPSLTGKPLDQEIADVLQQRTPVYEALATHIFRCGNSTADQIAWSLAKTIRAREGSSEQ